MSCFSTLTPMLPLLQMRFWLQCRENMIIAAGEEEMPVQIFSFL